MPTEWQWQAVADYDGTFTYGCGTTIDHNKANYAGANPLELSYYPYTTPVDYYDSFGYGLNDMAGNVYEWTDSCYDEQCEPDRRTVHGGDWYLNGRASGEPYWEFISLGLLSHMICK